LHRLHSALPLLAEELGEIPAQVAVHPELDQANAVGQLYAVILPEAAGDA
jgi:hypothetical protein